VDLLWFGGIGTYVKGAAENNVKSAIRPTMACASMAQHLRVQA
jgi:NAD-specific glutamate dehydrogenase